MAAAEPAQQRRPLEPPRAPPRFGPLRTIREDLLRRRELLANRCWRPGPAVVEHQRARGPRPDAPLLRPGTKPLRVLVGADVPTEPHAAHLASIPVPVGGDGVDVAVDVEV